VTAEQAPVRSATSASRRVAVGAIAVAGILVVAALVTRIVPPTTVVLEDSGVRVELTYTGGSRGEVVAVFHPLDAGFHVYGPELPRDGIDGAGRPTLLELSEASAWSSTGPLVAEPPRTLQSLPSFDQPFPVFPDGPATLRLPVELDASAPPGTDLVVSLTYMACSSSGLCLAPVIGREISVPTRS
jgi:hypothetical protein